MLAAVQGAWGTILMLTGGAFAVWLLLQSMRKLAAHRRRRLQCAYRSTIRAGGVVNLRDHSSSARFLRSMKP